jgi:hypothetical protein
MVLISDTINQEWKWWTALRVLIDERMDVIWKSAIMWPSWWWSSRNRNICSGFLDNFKKPYIVFLNTVHLVGSETLIQFNITLLSNHSLHIVNIKYHFLLLKWSLMFLRTYGCNCLSDRMGSISKSCETVSRSTFIYETSHFNITASWCWWTVQKHCWKCSLLVQMHNQYLRRISGICHIEAGATSIKCQSSHHMLNLVK